LVERCIFVFYDIESPTFVYWKYYKRECRRLQNCARALRVVCKTYKCDTQLDTFVRR
jgi:hypothetical protein